MSRIVLVTGGTRGIGKAISVGFKKQGYTVVANYASNDEKAKMFTDETGIVTYKWDVSDYQQCEDTIAKITSEVGAIEILINNAGITRDAMMHKLTPENWGAVINTNLTSCYNMSHAVLSAMRDNKFGRIINVSSINAQMGQLGQTNYSAAKAGVIGFTKALARETAIKGITVNTVAPGYIKTDMTASVPEKVTQMLLEQIPVRRFGEPEEIARSVLFLAADEAGFITGETLSVNGGHKVE